MQYHNTRQERATIMNKQGGGEARKILTLQYEQKIEQSNRTRAARVAQGCTDDGVRMDTGTLCE